MNVVQHEIDRIAFCLQRASAPRRRAADRRNREVPLVPGCGERLRPFPIPADHCLKRRIACRSLCRIGRRNEGGVTTILEDSRQREANMTDSLGYSHLNCPCTPHRLALPTVPASALGFPTRSPAPSFPSRPGLARRQVGSFRWPAGVIQPAERLKGTRHET